MSKTEQQQPSGAEQVAKRCVEEIRRNFMRLSWNGIETLIAAELEHQEICEAATRTADQREELVRSATAPLRKHEQAEGGAVQASEAGEWELPRQIGVAMMEAYAAGFRGHEIIEIVHKGLATLRQELKEAKAFHCETIQQRTDLRARLLKAEQAEGETGKDVDARGCPCLYVEPCSDNCSCAYGFMSGGCSRCCRYGSLEQRTSTAHAIAAQQRQGDNCPFCAGLGVLIKDGNIPKNQHVWIQCNDCGARGPAYKLYEGKLFGSDRAWTAWRQQRQPAPEQKEVGDWIL